MDKKNYYGGPDGVFYDTKHDEIFILEYEGVEIMNRNFEIIGRQYFYHGKNGEGKVYKKRLAVTGMENCVLLGDL